MSLLVVFKMATLPKVALDGFRPDAGTPAPYFPGVKETDLVSVPVLQYDRGGSLLKRISQGKVAELRQEMNSGGKKDKNHSAKKIALKKIVANMTMTNNDMIALFPDIISCMHIPSLEIKKMSVNQILITWMTAKFISRCFLYLVNYSRLKTDVALKGLPLLLEVCRIRSSNR
jgi:hypothetical protein